MQSKTLLQSNPRALLLPFIGALLVSFITLTLIAIYDAWRFGEYLHVPYKKHLALAIAILTLAGTWFLIYKNMYPKKWVGSVLFDFENRKITLNPGTQNREVPFEDIQKIRFKAATSMFNTGYLFFLKVHQEAEQPLIALTDDNLANDLYFTLEKANIPVKQDI
jgi:hypothetical protein